MLKICPNKSEHLSSEIQLSSKTTKYCHLLMVEYVCGYPNCKDNSQIFGPLKYGSDMSILDKSLNSYSPKLTSPSRMAIMSLFF